MDKTRENIDEQQKSHIEQQTEFLDSKEFYNLMQTYRHSPFVPMCDVHKAFENVKAFIRKNFNNNGYDV